MCVLQYLICLQLIQHHRRLVNNQINNCSLDMITSDDVRIFREIPLEGVSSLRVREAFASERVRTRREFEIEPGLRRGRDRRFTHIR